MQMKSPAQNKYIYSFVKPQCNKKLKVYLHNELYFFHKFTYQRDYTT